MTPASDAPLFPALRPRLAALSAILALAPGCITIQYRAPAAAPCPPPADAASAAQAGGAASPSGDYSASPSGDYSADVGGDYGRRPVRFALTVEGSDRVDDPRDESARLFGLGFYVIPEEAPLGVYLNTRFTLRSSGDPDFTDVFAFNAFGHDVVDEELEAFVINVGVVRALSESVALFAGLGFAATAIEAELRDPAGVFGNGGRYYQRRREDEDLNVNIGALVTLHPLALSVQWDTALEVLSLGVGFSF